MYNSIPHPTVYVLMRTFKQPATEAEDSIYYTFLDDAIRSVKANAEAYQGCVKLVINDDSPKTDISYSEHKKHLFSILSKHHFCVKDLNLIFGETDVVGSSYATYIVRKQFLLNSIEEPSEQNAIAVSLDQDDELAVNSLTNIADEICSTQSDICISAYETEDDRNLSIIKDNGKSHNEKARQLHQNPRMLSGIEDVDMLLGIDTLGWTKSWTRSTLRQYFDYMTVFLSKFRGSPGSYFAKYKAYEDFLDTMVLLMKGVKLCGMPTPAHKYRKQSRSITSTPSLDAFREDRAANLITLNDFAHFSSAHLIENYEPLLGEFISNKTRIIERILSDYRKRYELNGELEYEPFAEETYPGYFMKQLYRKTVEFNAMKNK